MDPVLLGFNDEIKTKFMKLRKIYPENKENLIRVFQETGHLTAGVPFLHREYLYGCESLAAIEEVLRNYQDISWYTTPVSLLN